MERIIEAVLGQPGVYTRASDIPNKEGEDGGALWL